jgi:hypothetical protein
MFFFDGFGGSSIRRDMAVSSVTTSTIFLPASNTGSRPSQGAVMSFSSPNPKVYKMYYGTKSATFTPMPSSAEASGVYRMTRAVKITKPEVIMKGSTIYQKTNVQQSRIRGNNGNTSPEMSVYRPGGNAAAWYSPTQGRIVATSSYCPTCNR